MNDEKMRMQYSLGGLLYLPSVNKNIIQKIKDRAFSHLTSLAFCLEDAIQDDFLDEAEKNLGDILAELVEFEKGGDKDSLPLIFIRIRNPKHMKHILKLYASYQDIITGYILPKFDLSNMDEYLAITKEINATNPKSVVKKIYIMPILESRMVAEVGTRVKVLLRIKEALDTIQEYVLNVRVGGNDFCNLYGLRRSVNQSIYDIGVIRDIFVDIINIFSSDYVVSGPVWEYFGMERDGKWDVGLERELVLDQLNGFIGKTAIHPTQLPMIYESMKVKRSDYDDAMKILSWDNRRLGVEKSEDGSRMNEVKVHGKWAKKMVMLGNIYGIKAEEKEREYTEADVLRLAKRFHNTKRSYLLVDPLQGKHLSVHPSEAIDLFHALGKKVSQVFGGVKLVIGFAETATAVGMGVAEEVAKIQDSCDCIYIHTTREELSEVLSWIEFREEHSHAVEQKLDASNLGRWIRKTDTIVFVDDEISTGKTILNFVQQLRIKHPALAGKNLVAASIIQRLSKENQFNMAQQKIECVSILNLECMDYENLVKKYNIEEAKEAESYIDAEDTKDAGLCFEQLQAKRKLLDPRKGVRAREYSHHCVGFARSILNEVKFDLDNRSILVLGTEECMYPAMILGREIENSNHYSGVKVFTHSTTRSPIGIAKDQEYPIQNGYKLKSLYDSNRITYIYNLRKYDQVIIVTDSREIVDSSLESMILALKLSGNHHILLVRG